MATTQHAESSLSLISDSSSSSRCIATTDIPEGSLLLKSSPLVAVLLEEQVSSRCSRCFKLFDSPSTKSSGRSCGRCQVERYCSTQCQQSAWDEYHSTLCPILPSLLYSFRSNNLSEHQRHSALLLAKLIARYFTGTNGTATTNRTRLHSYLDLKTSQIRSDISDSISNDEITNFFSLLTTELPDEDEVIIDILHDRLRTPLLDLRFLLERFQRNNHVLSDERLRPFAHAVLPRISRACNHSCRPSGAVITRVEDSGDLAVSVRALRSLNPNEELTITYLDPILPLVERQTFLQQRYGFTCTCSLCTYQESIPPSIRAQQAPATPQGLSKLFSLVVGPALGGAKVTLGFDEHMNPLTNIEDIGLTLDVGMIRVPSSLLSCLKSETVTELTSIFSDACAEGEWQVGAVTGCHILGVYVAVYGWRYPLVGLHLLELSKTLLNSHIAITESTSLPKTFRPELLCQATIYYRWAQLNIGRLQTRTPLSTIPTPADELKYLLEALEGECQRTLST